MKKRTSKNLIKALMLGTAVLTASNKVEASNSVLKTTTCVNLREDSNTDSEIIGLLYEGETLDYVDYENGWYKVRYNGQLAYVSGDYVEYTTEYAEPTSDYEEYDYEEDLSTDCNKLVMLTTDSYIYTSPSYENPITYLLTYEFAEVYQKTNGFYLANTDGITGYIPVSNVINLSSKIVVVDISDQKLKLYDDNEVFLTSNVVTGKDETPSDVGLYNIYSKEVSRFLTGPGYSSYVNYWMPYNGGEGLHDATWRDEFGGDIYTWGGSHGCVNLPLEVAEEIYDNVDVGTQVLVKR